MKPSEPNLSYEEYTALLEKVASVSNEYGDTMERLKASIKHGDQTKHLFRDTAEMLKNFFTLHSEASDFVRKLCPDYTNEEVTASAIAFVAQYRTLTTEQQSQYDSFQDFLTQEKKEILEATKAFMEAAYDEENGETTTLAIRHIEKLNEYDFPVDKVNHRIWTSVKECEENYIKIKMEKKDDPDELNSYFYFDFSQIEKGIDRKLSPDDKLVYFAISSLYKKGYNLINLTIIYNAMGYTGRPGARDLDKINKSVTKMLSLPISLNNKEEAKKYKYPAVDYKGTLLQAEMLDCLNENGKISESAIHILREPPMYTFARGREQLSTIDIRVLQPPINKTPFNTLLLTYIIERILRIMNGRGGPPTILMETLCDELNLQEKSPETKKKTMQRLRKKLDEILSHFKQINFINGYTITKDRILLEVDIKKPKKKKKKQLEQ